MLEEVNKLNFTKLCLVPVVLVFLAEYQVIQGFVLGLLTLSLYGDIQKYGLPAVILRPDQGVVQTVFTMIQAGDLDGLKSLTKKMPPKNLV